MQKGFIALFSVLTLSGILLLLTAFTDYAAYLAHDAAADEYSYRKAQEAAFSCATFALSRLDADPLRFTGISTTTIQIDDISICVIISAYTKENTAKTLVQGQVEKSFVRMKVTASRISSSSPFERHIWEEY